MKKIAFINFLLSLLVGMSSGCIPHPGEEGKYGFIGVSFRSSNNSVQKVDITNLRPSLYGEKNPIIEIMPYYPTDTYYVYNYKGTFTWDNVDHQGPFTQLVDFEPERGERGTSNILGKLSDGESGESKFYMIDLVDGEARITFRGSAI